MTDKTNELKPCPFCGGKGRSLLLNHGGGYHRIGCTCGILVVRDTREEVVEAWNRRAGYAHAAAELRWIPVKTKYPDRPGIYDVTLFDGTISKSAFYVGAFDKSVIAWMPIPTTPYTEPADNIAEVGDNCPHLHTKRLVLPANKRKQFDEPFAYHCTDCNRTFEEKPIAEVGERDGV